MSFHSRDAEDERGLFESRLSRMEVLRSLSLSLSLSLPLSLGERSKEDREEREGIRERQTGKYYLIKFIFT